MSSPGSLPCCPLHKSLPSPGDCAVNMNPNSEELAQIAIVSADTAKAFGVEPRVAMLSYSTLGSGEGPDVSAGGGDTAKAFGVEPRVAMLSYSTLGSGEGPDVSAGGGGPKLDQGEGKGGPRGYCPNARCSPVRCSRFSSFVQQPWSKWSAAVEPHSHPPLAHRFRRSPI